MNQSEEFPATPERSLAETFELPGEQFLRWWQMMDPEDRDEFRWLYQGDELHARFVCALDLLIIAKVQGGDQQSLIQLAYHVAAKPYPQHRSDLSSAELRPRAFHVYNHPAVQALLERVRLRTRLRERIRIENLALKEAESMLKDAGERTEDDKPVLEMKDRRFALDVAIKIMELADFEQGRIRAERTKKGLEKARKAALEAEPEDALPVMRTTIKALASKLGKDEVIRLLTDDGDA